MFGLAALACLGAFAWKQAADAEREAKTAEAARRAQAIADARIGAAVALAEFELAEAQHDRTGKVRACAHLQEAEAKALGAHGFTGVEQPAWCRTLGR